MGSLGKLFDATGQAVPLGQKLGSGGEGDVFEVPATSPRLVAKVYRRSLNRDKQEKLIAMVRGGDDDLRKTATWPTTALHIGRNGPVRGFLMPKLTKYEPIHKIYNPAQRKQLFPDRDWAFLVSVARNVASAFHAIHKRGHVIGDVNQANTFVAGNALVKLIDCDSFQINAKGKLYLCEVGVPHFTAPELQHLKSFHETRRTENHDNFGLALLCFHLLLMGRHPFAGVYSDNEDIPIEEAIRGFRFEYGKHRVKKGLSLPQGCVTMDILPPQVVDLFERAFSESGALRDGRPKAREWIGMLDYLKHNLRSCGQEPSHKYFGGLETCPWCEQEHQAGVMFFIRRAAATFDLAVVWEQITSISPPSRPQSIYPGQFTLTPNPLPEKLRFASANAKALAVVKRVLTVGILLSILGIVASGDSHPALAIFLIALVFIRLFLPDSGDSPIKQERKNRQRILKDAEDRWSEVVKRLTEKESAKPFDEKLQELTRLKTRYNDLEAEFSKEKQKLQDNIRERQLSGFLERHRIADHKIPQIGPRRKATLALFGIETAADIEQSKIWRIEGFGRKYTQGLLRWRDSIERSFVFNASKGIDPADVSSLKQRFRQRKIQIEKVLLSGPQELKQIKEQITRKYLSLQTEVETAAKAVAQARADLSVFR